QRHKDDEDDDADQGHQDQVSDRSHDTISGSFSALAISCTTKSLMRMLAKCASIASWPIMSSGNGRSICLRPACRTALRGAAVDRGLRGPGRAAGGTTGGARRPVAKPGVQPAARAPPVA